MSKDNGGQAFPTHNYQDNRYKEQGMTLRDYFAAKAMQGILVNPAESYEYGSVQILLAKCAYQIADAMLNERAK